MSLLLTQGTNGRQQGCTKVLLWELCTSVGLIRFDNTSLPVLVSLQSREVWRGGPHVGDKVSTIIRKWRSYDMPRCRAPAPACQLYLLYHYEEYRLSVSTTSEAYQSPYTVVSACYPGKHYMLRMGPQHVPRL